MGLMSLIFPLLLLGIMIAWGFVIGTRNVVIRIIGVGVSLIAAIITVITLKSAGFSTVSPILDTLLSGTEYGDLILDFLHSAETLGDSMVSIATAFAAPIVFAVSFVFFAIITMVIGWIISLIVALVSSNKDRKKRSALIIVPCVIAQALITLFVLLTPVAAYGEIANKITERVDVENDETATVIVQTIDEFEFTPVIAVYRIAGGEAVCKGLTSFKIGGEKSDLLNESDAIGRIIGNAMYLTEHKISEYGEDEANAIRDLSDGISDSIVLPAIAGEVVYSATDAWLEDESFLGAPSPDLDEIGAGIFAETFTHLLQIFHNDARDHDAFCADLNTIANTVVILAEDGVFRSMGEEGNALIDKLSEGGTVSKLVAEFDSNPGFKILIADITGIGMRAIGTVLNVPENEEEIYSDFTGSIANELNTLNNSGMSDDEKCAELADIIRETFAEAEIEYQLDAEVVKLYAEKIVADFGSYGEITEEDIAEYFRAYSEAEK